MHYRMMIPCAVLLLGGPLAYAQTVQWATTVLEFSSQYSDTASSAQQILGKPNVLPTGGDSPMAWAVAADDEGTELDDRATISVGFATPMSIRQVAVGENKSPGAITRIIAIDEGDEEHEVYSAEPHPLDVTARMLNIFMPKTPYRVKAITITMQPGDVSGWNEIDAVGISDSETPITATINVHPNLTSGSEPENLGTNVNSEADELVDAISPDGKTLYISRQIDDDEMLRDIWYCTLQANGEWSRAVNIGPPINNDANNYANSITPDGNSLLLATRYNEDGSYKGNGVSLSHRTMDGWSVPEEVVIEDWHNRAKLANYALSPDQKFMLLSLKRDDTYGYNDLYVSLLRQDGSWSKPMNLGPGINTPGTDMAPFLAADGVTLYYSTNGRSGYGDNDIFMSRRLDDSWTNWSEPQNLGPSINTPKDETFYTLSAAGDYAFFSSAENSYGQSDIFRIALPQAIRPQPVVMVRGRVLNAKTGAPIASEIRYESLPSGKEAGIARSHPSTGDYKIALPSNANFGFRAEAEGYYPVSENVNTSGVKEYEEIEQDLYLAPIEVGATVRLNNIFFETGKWELKPESFPELDRVVVMLKANTGIRIAIAGHTDNIGSDADNLTLSRNRAKSVLDYLAAHAVASDRLASNGYGETKPVATNDTDAGRQMNRRVEFTIVGK